MFKRGSGFYVRIGLLLMVLAVTAVGAQQDKEEARLSLDECLRTALQNNLDLVSARMDPQISRQNVVSQQAFFDPTLFAGASHAESEQEISNAFSLNESESDSANAGISQNLNFGADYSVSLSGANSSASGPLVAVESTYNSVLDLTFNLPLLNGLGKEPNTEQLVLARGNEEISREQLRVEVHRVLEQVEGAYWDLLATQEALRIARVSLTRAEDLLELNRKKVEVGTLAPIEITQAEAEVASEIEGVIVAEVNLENAEDELRRLMAVPRDDPLWEKAISGVDRPSFAPIAVDLDEALETALAERPELFNVQQGLRNRELSERVARSRTRPNLDFRFNYRPAGNNFESVIDPGPDGIVGTIDDGPTMQNVEGQLFESIKEIPDLDNFSWSASLNFTYALGNHQAKANYAIASINREKAEVDVAKQEQTIRVEIRRAVRLVQSGIKRVEAAQANVQLQTKKLEAEQKKFENGMSTSFEVLSFQRDLADAELGQIRAALDYIKSITALERAKGTLLQARGLSLAPTS